MKSNVLSIPSRMKQTRVYVVQIVANWATTVTIPVMTAQ